MRTRSHHHDSHPRDRQPVLRAAGRPARDTAVRILAALVLVPVLSCSASPVASPDTGGGPEPPSSGVSEPGMDGTGQRPGADEPPASSGPGTPAGGTAAPSPAEGFSHPGTSAEPTPAAGASPDPDNAPEAAGASPDPDNAPEASGASPDPDNAPEASVHLAPDPDNAPQTAADPGPELDLGLIIEAIDQRAPRGSPGGSRQDLPLEPLEPAGPAGPAGPGGLPSAQGEAYSWHDGDRTLQARLQLDLVATGDGEIRRRDDVAAGTGNGRTTARSADGDSAAGAAGVHPVFLSDSGTLMTLPGGVILILDEGWNTDRAAAFLARNGISPDRVSGLDYLANGFFVETEPGFASLDLANALAAQPGVELSQPNWRRDRTTR